MKDNEERYDRLWAEFDEVDSYGDPPRRINVLVPAVLLACGMICLGILCWVLA